MVIQCTILSICSTSIRNSWQTSSFNEKSTISNRIIRNSPSHSRISTITITSKIILVCLKKRKLSISFFPISRGMSLSLNDFETMVKRHSKDTIEYTKKFYNHIKTILNMTRETCAKKLHMILKSLEEDNMTT
jgi:hypothetical protein